MIALAAVDAGSIRAAPRNPRDPFDTPDPGESRSPHRRARGKPRTLWRDRPIRRNSAALLIHHLDERVHRTLAPLLPALAEQLCAHGIPREPLAVWAVSGHRVVAIRDRDHRDLERQLIALEAARIPHAVVALVVREHELGTLPELR